MCLACAKKSVFSRHRLLMRCNRSIKKCFAVAPKNKRCLSKEFLGISFFFYFSFLLFILFYSFFYYCFLGFLSFLIFFFSFLFSLFFFLFFFLFLYGFFLCYYFYIVLHICIDKWICINNIFAFNLI